MSHSVTIRTQTVTTSSSGSTFVNSGYLRSYAGLLKFIQLILGIVCVGIAIYWFHQTNYWMPYYNFFLTITTTFMIGTFILLLSYLLSISAESMVSKTIYELLYHAIGFALLLAASLTFLVQVSGNDRARFYGITMTAAICGLINSILYLFSTILALRTNRTV